MQREEAYPGKVVIDPGHGGHETTGSSTALGVRGPSGTLEKDVNLALAQRVARELGDAAVLTRDDDRNLALAARCEIARRYGARIFVSIHANGGHGGRGSEAFVHARAEASSRSLARAIQGELARFGGGPGDAQSGELAVLTPERHAPGTAACLLEVDYLSEADGERRLRDPRALDDMSRAIVQGIRRYGRGASNDAHLRELNRHRSQAQVAWVPIIGLGIAVFSLINAVSQREAGSLRYGTNTTKAIHNYPQGVTPNPWNDGFSIALHVDCISGLSSVWAFFKLFFRYNGNDIDQCRVELDGSSDWTVSSMSVTFEGNEAPSYEQNSVGAIMMYMTGSLDPAGAGDVDFAGRILVKADGTTVNQDLRITRGNASNFTITEDASLGGYVITKN